MIKLNYKNKNFNKFFKEAFDRMIPEDKSYDMPELIVDVMNDGHKVGIYPISDNSWIDVGQWPEYNKALERF